MCRFILFLILVLLAAPVSGMEFSAFDSFAPYQSPQLGPFLTMPDFSEEPFKSYGPGPTSPNVELPEYEERPYQEIAPPKEPDVQMDMRTFRNYKGYRPMAPIQQGPIRQMRPFDFAPFKPLDVK